MGISIVASDNTITKESPLTNLVLLGKLCSYGLSTISLFFFSTFLTYITSSVVGVETFVVNRAK
jgi:hypothetical protein